MVQTYFESDRNNDEIAENLSKIRIEENRTRDKQWRGY